MLNQAKGIRHQEVNALSMPLTQLLENLNPPRPHVQAFFIAVCVCVCFLPEVFQCLLENLNQVHKGLLIFTLRDRLSVLHPGLRWIFISRAFGHLAS